MSFVQLEFVGFYVSIFVLYWTIGDRRLQNLLLAVGSAVFYGWVHPWFLVLLYSSAVLDYSCGLAMARWRDRTGLFLAVSLAGNLGMLSYFKYFDFFVANVVTSLEMLGVSTNLHTLGIFLPVGISFYTFQTMSYTLDIYRGKLEPRRNFLDYVVFVSFFPQLVAGPVERAATLLPQMEKTRTLSMERMQSGVSLALWGAFKKVVIADSVAPYVDKIFILTEPAAPLVWVGAVGFAIQILADFSGYTDIARGTARMLGIELMENFKHPYLATSPSEFWRRWHISFSTWIRDYLYIPVGGSRGGFLSMTRATFIAMLLSGLWHGASWNFVVWGAFHATLLTGYRLATPRIPKWVRELPGVQLAAVGLIFFFTCVGWLIFRETHFDRLVSYATLSPWAASSDQWIAAISVGAVFAWCAAPMLIALAVERYALPQLRSSPWVLPAQTVAWTVWALCIFSFVRTTANDFIYFQF